MCDIEQIKILDECSKETPKFSLKGYRVFAKCVSVYDGDTVHAVFKMPHSNEYYKWIIRLVGVDTPEMKSNDTDMNMNSNREDAILARDFLRGRILDKIIIIDCQDFDKYGRLLGVIYLPVNMENITLPNISVNQQLINNGFANVYTGGTKTIRV